MRYRSTMADRPQTVALVERDRALITSDAQQYALTPERGDYVPQQNRVEPEKKILGFPKAPFIVMVVVIMAVLGIVAIVTGVVVSRKLQNEREPPASHAVPEVVNANLISGSSLAATNSGPITMVLYQDPEGAIRYYFCERNCDPGAQNDTAGVVEITRDIKQKTPLAVAGNITSEVHLFYMSGRNRIYQTTWISATKQWVNGTLQSYNQATENSSLAAVEYAGQLSLYFQSAESDNTIQEIVCSVAEQEWQKGSVFHPVKPDRPMVAAVWGEDDNISTRLWYFQMSGKLVQDTPGVGAKANESMSALPFDEGATISVTTWPVGAVYHTTKDNEIELYRHENGIWADKPQQVTLQDEMIADYRNPISAVQWFEGNKSRTRVFFQKDDGNLGVIYQSDTGNYWEYTEERG